MSSMIAPAVATTTTTLNIGTATVASKSPTPATASRQRRLEFVGLVTKPNGRHLDLDARDGVKTWAVRLGADEWSVGVSGVRFYPSDEDEDDGMDVDGSVDARKEEEEEGEDEDEPEAVVKQSPKRGRGRPKKKPGKSTATKVTSSKGKARAAGELQVKLNGVVVPHTGKKGEWEMKLPTGYNVLEIGENGGMVWRVYLERMAMVPGATAH